MAIRGLLGLVLVVGVSSVANAQDPFSLPGYEPILEPPMPVVELPIQEEPPIIQTFPAMSAEPQIRTTTLKSRTENAHVRTKKTEAQKYIQQRATYYAKQRAKRIEARKAAGKSLLRPGNLNTHAWWYEAAPPVWYSTYRK